MSSKLLSAVTVGKYKSRKIALKEASTAYMKNSKKSARVFVRKYY